MSEKLAASFRSNNSVVFLRKILHTYLTPKFLWERVITDYSDFLKKSPGKISKTRRIIKSLIWFWPSLQDATFWRDTTVGEVMGPQDYVTILDPSRVLVDELIQRTREKDFSVLDLGCNRGRFLNVLFESGVRDLHGVDISSAAIDSLAREYPEIFLKGSIKLQTMQEFLLEAAERSFNITYTHGATVELIPSSFPLVREICRVTGDFVIFFISEVDFLYPRFWESEFRKYGFILIKKIRPERNASGGKLSLLVFARQ